jgi:hypothetical protein
MPHGGAAAAPLAGARARPGLSSPPSSGLADGAHFTRARGDEKDPAADFLQPRVVLWFMRTASEKKTESRPMVPFIFFLSI